MDFNIDRRILSETALGNRPADTVIKDGVLMDVYTGRLVPHRSVALKDGWIAYVGPDADHTIGENTEIIEAGGRAICPGFMDAHTHVIVYWDIADFLSYAVPCGVTTLFTEVEAYAFAAGMEGFRAFLDQIRDRPVKLFALVPPMVCLSPAADSMATSPSEMREFLKDPLVMGLGEPFWQGTILTPENRVIKLIEETLKAGKSVEGHAAGAFDRKLAAYTATGVQSCHEAITTEDVISRLELGLYAMIREGDIRRDLEIIRPLKGESDLRRVILVTDGTNPRDLITRGYLIDVVQKAVDMGFSPVEAVQMVTLNPAEHFRVDHLTGGIAPGRLADILILPEPGTVRPDLVISNGVIVAREGRVTVEMKKVPYPDTLLKTVRVDPLSPSDLTVSAKDSGGSGSIRVIHIQPGGLVSREQSVRPRVVDGKYAADPERDLLKIVFIERLSGRGQKFIGFVRGWGQKRGAVATTLCWDAGGMVGIGANDNDLALAINRVIELQGGTVLCVDGECRVEIPLPVGGYISQLSIPETAARLEEFEREVSLLGSDLSFAHLSLNVLTTAAIPFIRMNEKGYYRFREKDTVTLL